MLTDEEALRSALVDVTLGQPTQPADRVTAVRRRHVHRRFAQASAAAIVAAVAVAGTVVGVNAVEGQTGVSSLNHDVPSWALPWDDHRDGSVPQHVLDNAVTAWWRLDGAAESPAPPRRPTNVVWYVGQLVARGDAVVVVFEVDTGSSHRLVAGWATASEVLQGQPPVSDASSAWVFYDVAAPPASYSGVVGFHVHGNSTTAPNPDDWVVLLTRPDAVSAQTSAGGSPPMEHGFVVFDVGQVTFGPFEVSVRLSNGRWIGGSVGVPGAPKSQVPQLAAPAPLSYPGKLAAGLGGQGPSALAAVDVGHAGQTATIYTRCVGGDVRQAPSTLRIRLNHSDRFQPRPSDFVGTAPCDGAQHALDVPALRAKQRWHLLMVHSSPYASWTVAMVLGRPA